MRVKSDRAREALAEYKKKHTDRQASADAAEAALAALDAAWAAFNDRRIEVAATFSTPDLDSDEFEWAAWREVDTARAAGSNTWHFETTCRITVEDERLTELREEVTARQYDLRSARASYAQAPNLEVSVEIEALEALLAETTEATVKVKKEVARWLGLAVS